eukprot:GHVS01050165.1.p1 GENE.GHVS01050165.1~~GHVS01050165.1.p1  ORF type:complete len:657 (-),score=97.87 GHVS01050165.1:133-2103(-)
MRYRTTVVQKLATKRENRYHHTVVSLFIPLLSSAVFPPVLSVSSPHWFSCGRTLGSHQSFPPSSTLPPTRLRLPTLFVEPRCSFVRRSVSCAASQDGMADIMTEVVPRSTGCDPAGVRILGCEKADKGCISVQAVGDIAAIKADAFVAGVVGVASEEEDARGSDGGDVAMTNGVPSETVELSTELKKFDRECGDGVMSEMIEREDFKGKAGTWCSGRLPFSNNNIRNVVLLGCGTPKDLTPSACGKLGADLAALLKSVKAKSVALYLPLDFSPRQLQALVESLLVNSSPDNRFKSLKSTFVKPPPFEKLELLVAPAAKESVEKAVSSATKLARGVYFAQQLVAAPANYINTITLAQEAARMARKLGLTTKVLDQADIEKLNMGAYLAVAKGSMYPPRFIHLTYKPADGVVKKKLVFIGKGVCFDAGGYNIKSASSQIELMKFDMGGAAAVLGAAQAIGELKPPNVEVHFIVAAAENMVSDKAYRPGDVITASNGKTIEVGNTDAEGRLTLADALVYAEKLQPDAIVDIATLTGACLVALGPKYAGVFSPQDKFAQTLLDCGKDSGELLWRMPLVTEYREMLESKIADMNNIGGGGKGGAITAAVFLREFVGKTPWAHIDIAGPAWDQKESKATGFGVRTLTELAIRTADNSDIVWT